MFEENAFLGVDMPDLKDKIQNLKNEFEVDLKNVSNLRSLDDLRIKYLGKKSLVTDLLGQIKNFSVEEKKEFGPLINQFKIEADNSIEEAKAQIIFKQTQSENFKKQNFDVSAYQPNITTGTLHPLTQIVREVEDIFVSMGYEVIDGPEVESEEYNFEALNVPKDHPARDMQDTFWLDIPGMVLRTQTSSMQVHAMRNKSLPLAVISPGKVFRQESTDATHDYVFMQCEGMLIDENVNISNLFATLQTFLKTLFKTDSLDIRIRPGFFPFVEPGFEIDMRCPFCKNGCSVCKRSTWIELFPGGMIHPNVLRINGIDPEKYSGFAFGFGLTRLAMLKYNIDDIRLFYGGNIKFLNQF
ncbi:MAG: phenylalanine--tRNA ligase subunit alpha [Candidatus Babeliales bacterium]|jgi:phenylalanyl-tRNA synthetase alpha chain